METGMETIMENDDIFYTNMSCRIMVTSIFPLCLSRIARSMFLIKLHAHCTEEETN